MSMLKRSQYASTHAPAAAATSWRNTRKTRSIDLAALAGCRRHDFPHGRGGVAHVALSHRGMDHEHEAGFAQTAGNRQRGGRREPSVDERALEVDLAAAAFGAGNPFRADRRDDALARPFGG